jgi:hypothetical protein
MPKVLCCGHGNVTQHRDGTPLPAALDEQPVLQRGDVEKCKAWRTRSVTDFPAVRHVLGTERWCGQRTCLRRPRPLAASAENKSAPPWLRHIEGCWGLPFSTAKARYAETRPQKSRHTSITLACRIGRPPSRNGRVGTRWRLEHFTASSIPNDCCSRKWHVWGTRQSPLAAYRRRLCCVRHCAGA